MAVPKKKTSPSRRGKRNESFKENSTFGEQSSKKFR